MPDKIPIKRRATSFWDWMGGKWKWEALAGVSYTMIKFGEYGVGLFLLALAGFAVLSKIAHWDSEEGLLHIRARTIRTVGQTLVVLTFIFLTIVTFTIKGNGPWSNLSRQKSSPSPAPHPQFTTTATYQPTTNEVMLIFQSFESHVSRSVHIDRWIEVGHLRREWNGKDAIPKTYFDAVYNTRNGIAMINGFVPIATSLGGSANLSDIPPGGVYRESWVDQTPELLRALRISDQSVLRDKGTLSYLIGEASQPSTFHFCYEIRLVNVGPHIGRRILLNCEGDWK